MEQSDNSFSQMKKGVLELCILSLLNANELYPADIAEQMHLAALPIPEGTLYSLLTRLKNSGHIVYRWEESQEGPPRKYFSLSETGKDYLKSMNHNWQQLITSVAQIINTK
jgi:PadR family transcriptional regulator, regulatory protein PadR